MRKIKADYIFPISSPPVKDGVVIIDDKGIVVDVLSPSSADYGLSDVEIYEGVICPGFINTHCHLELSYLKNKIPAGAGIDNFIIEVEKQKKSESEEDNIVKSIIEAENEMLGNGIVAVGDISNTGITFPVKAKSRLRYHTFIEVYGSDPVYADERFDKALELYSALNGNNRNNEASIVPHAAYSVSEKLFEKIKQFAGKDKGLYSIHHQEYIDETRYFFDKSGGIKKRADKMGFDISSFKPTGLRPLESVFKYLPDDSNILLVHNIYATKQDIDFALQNNKKIWWCLCPDSNLFIENKLPDIELFYKNNLNITLGTDSLASNTALSVLDELKTISVHCSHIPLNDLLKWATLNGAAFLNINDHNGSLEKGKRPGINLIEGINLKELKLTSESRVRVIA